ncbi:MAG: hypothetical protein U0031_09965 [Thermomicrobiales bacterium]
MTPRSLLTTIGATALGFGVIIAGAPVATTVHAQEAPAAVQAPAGQNDTFEQERAQAYSDFVSSLADELGSDDAAVDSAIRNALKEQVDARQTAGEIDAAQATAVKAMIDSADAPLFAFGGRGGPHGFAGHEGRHGPDGRGDFEDQEPRGGDDQSAVGPDGSQPPASAPSDDQASDEGAPGPVTPGEEVTF